MFGQVSYFKYKFMSSIGLIYTQRIFDEKGRIDSSGM